MNLLLFVLFVSILDARRISAPATVFHSIPMDPDEPYEGEWSTRLIPCSYRASAAIFAFQKTQLLRASGFDVFHIHDVREATITFDGFSDHQTGEYLVGESDLVLFSSNYTFYYPTANLTSELGWSEDGRNFTVNIPLFMYEPGIALGIRVKTEEVDAIVWVDCITLTLDVVDITTVHPSTASTSPTATTAPMATTLPATTTEDSGSGAIALLYAFSIIVVLGVLTTFVKSMLVRYKDEASFVFGVSAPLNDQIQLQTLIPHSYVKLDRMAFSTTHRETWIGTFTRPNETSVLDVTCVCMRREAEKGEMEHDMQIHDQLQHKTIINFLGVVTLPRPNFDEETRFIVFECMELGTLKQCLKRSTEQPLDRLIKMCADVVSAMTFVEEMHYVHCDVRAQSFSVNSGFVVKLSSLSRARRVPTHTSYVTCGPAELGARWAAPEVLLTNRHTHKSDMWSFGMLLFEIFSNGSDPYGVIPHNKALELIYNNIHPEFPEHTPAAIKKITEEKILCAEPERRANFFEIHPLFLSINE